MNLIASTSRRLGMALGLVLALCGSARAVLPLPDQVVYGTIAIQNKPVTNNASGTNVLVEARRASDNALLASYRMGSSASPGPLFYAVRVPMEDAPASSPAFAQPDDLLVLTVKKGSAVQFTSTNIILASGSTLRLDFGASVDTDGDGIPDAWELAQAGPAALDSRGVNYRSDFASGTAPSSPKDAFALFVQKTSNSLTEVSFRALASDGVGYAGLTRCYALEQTTNLAAGLWRPVSNYDHIVGANQTVAYSSASPANVLFRGRVWLEGTMLSVDANCDGLPDQWQLAQVTGADYQRYVAGDNQSPLAVAKTNNGALRVSFTALQPQGPGYEGRTRYYALESATNFSKTAWRTVPNMSRIRATNQEQVLTIPPAGPGSFFRSRVWLEGP